MDYQFMEMNSEIYIELSKGSVVARRVDAHSTRVRIDKGMESFVRVFTSKNKVVIKAIANVDPEIQLLVPPGVKVITVIGGKMNVELYDFTLDAFAYKGSGDIIMKGMEIRKVCEIDNERGSVNMKNSFMRGLNMQKCGGSFTTERTYLKGSNTLYLEKCQSEIALVGSPESYNIKPMGSITAEQVLINGNPLDESRNKGGMNWILVAGKMDRSRTVRFNMMENQLVREAEEKALFQKALEKAMIERTLGRSKD